MLAELEQIRSGLSNQWDFGNIDTKPCSKGIRLRVFCLSKHNSTLNEKLSEQNVEAIRLAVSDCMGKYLGNVLDVVCHPYTDSGRNAVDFFGYVAYEEML